MSRTKTLLDGVNDVLIRVGQIDSQSKLVSLINQSRQRYIDSIVFLWRDSVQDIYTLTSKPMPIEMKEADPPIVLVADKREYDLPDDLIQIRWPLEDRVNGLRIYNYPGGYETMRWDQRIPDRWEGLPYRACINPINRKLRMDRTPLVQEDGRVYQLSYDRTVIPQQQFDVMPFEDDVYESMVPLVTMMFEMKQAGQTTTLGSTAYGRAAQLLSAEQMASHY